jgi:prepilin-type processing-associated H-X9-DG protein
MKTNFRQSLIQTCLLAAVMLALPDVAQAQFNYTSTNGTITITKYTGPGGAVTIPATINGLAVTCIGDSAFYECYSLTNVTIPDSVANIGIEAFDGCLNLTNITIPNSVTSIGGGAFANCSAAAGAAIGNSVTNIGDFVFDACTKLTAITMDTNNPAYSSADGVLFDKGQTSLVEYPGGKGGNYMIPNSVTSIGKGAFEACWRLASVTIPDSVTVMGDSAFGDDLALTNVTIGDSLTNIGVGAFGNCESLALITVDTNNPVYSSVNGVLFDKHQITLILCPEGIFGSYTIPDTVTSISDYAFDRTGLASITIPNSVTNIGHYTFGESLSLTNVTIPNSVTSIEDAAFDYCFSLTSVTIPDSVVSIGDDAFFECSRLSSVTIPDSVTSIGDWAFLYCGLTNVTIGDGVTNIGIATFYECEGLTSVTIGNSVTSIEVYAFYLCTSLTKVTIPKSVTGIGGWAFVGCDSLTSIYFEGNAPAADETVFDTSDDFTYSAKAYYLPGTTGWADFSANTGIPAVPWLPLIQTGDGSLGVRTNQFGFNIAWTSGQTVVVEACTNLHNPVWSPVATNTLTSDSSYFSDPSGFILKTRESLIITPSPSDAYVFIDDNEGTIDDGIFIVRTVSWYDYPADRHGQGANLSFLDGHVEHKRWADPKLGNPPPGSAPRPGGDATDHDWLIDHSPTQ